MRHWDKMEYILLWRKNTMGFFFSKDCLLLLFPNAVLKLVVYPKLLARTWSSKSLSLCWQIQCLFTWYWFLPCSVLHSKMIWLYDSSYGLAPLPRVSLYLPVPLIFSLHLFYVLFVCITYLKVSFGSSVLLYNLCIGISSRLHLSPKL